MTFQRTYDDDQLGAAVATQHSWRGVLRALGLTATSAGSQRSVRRHADRLGLDYSHFTGQRSWTDAALIDAVAASGSWSQVAAALGIRGGSSHPLLRGHALRLGLDNSHFNAKPEVVDGDGLAPDQRQLFRAGALLAAAWFEASGASVAWPLEPARYDLMAHTPRGTKRIQVKTTINRSGSTYAALLSTSSHSAPGRRVYDPDEIDEFFIIDAQLNFYRIPISAVAGRKQVHLSAYAGYRVAGFRGTETSNHGVASAS